jgi:hypothetical protein
MTLHPSFAIISTKSMTKFVFFIEKGLTLHAAINILASANKYLLYYIAKASYKRALSVSNLNEGTESA